ncbi:MAG: hypothetical protein IPI83_11805 [Sphingomonadales bacterium]|nr:hypothetical protein [Sphingomonadales bacterium]
MQGIIDSLFADERDQLEDGRWQTIVMACLLHDISNGRLIRSDRRRLLG